MKKKQKQKKNEKQKIVAPKQIRLQPKKKSLIFVIPKDKKKIISNNLTSKIFLPEIINILKKTRKDRSFNEINRLNEFLIANYKYFQNLRNNNDSYQYSRILAVLKYTEVPQGKNIVTFDEEGDRCYILLQGEISVLKPQYIEKKLTMKDYIDYLKQCEQRDPSHNTQKRIIEKNNHINIDIYELLDRPGDTLDDREQFNIFVEKFEKIFEAKDGFTFGETALLHKQKRNATIRAEKYCKLIYVDKMDYNKIMKESEKKRIDDEIKHFVSKFYFFNKWGSINIYKLYSLMTDIKLYKNDVLYRQNEDSEYIYFCINGACEQYSYISLNWKKDFINYISDFSTNFFLMINKQMNISYLKLIKLIKEAKNRIPVSPMVFRDFNFGKFNLSLYEEKNIDDLICNKDQKFSDPYDLFKISINKIKENDIVGLEEVAEFKKRFSTIKAVSDSVHFKRIKAIDFFKLYVSSTNHERNDEVMINYICDKKRMIIKQIDYLSNYKKNKELDNYIEEYNICYNNINIKNRMKSDKMTYYINSLSKNNKALSKSKNLFRRKISRLKSSIIINHIYKPNDIENQKNEYKDFKNKFKSNSKINIRSNIKLAPSKLFLNQRNFNNLDYKFKFESAKSKFSSFSHLSKNQAAIKFKDDSSYPNNNKSTSFSSNKTNTYRNFTKLNKAKNLFNISLDKSFNENDSFNLKRSRNINIKTNKFHSFNKNNYKKNLYCKYGFFINEIIKLGLGPNIRLKKNMIILNNDVNTGEQICLDSNNNKYKKSFSFDKDIRQKRYEFLKITEL